MIKAVVFDLDDTLISERQYIESGYRHISHLLSEKYNQEEDRLFNLLMELFKLSPINVFNRLLDKLHQSYTNDNIMELVNEYRNHSPKINLYEDAILCLSELRERNIKTGIITDGYSNTQRQKLSAINAVEFINEIIVTDELGKDYWKPHPRAFEIMREKLNINYKEMVYVGDNPKKDFYISKLFPIKTIKVVRPDNIYLDSLYHHDIKEHFTVYSLMELLKVINKIN